MSVSPVWDRSWIDEDPNGPNVRYRLADPDGYQLEIWGEPTTLRPADPFSPAGQWVDSSTYLTEPGAKIRVIERHETSAAYWRMLSLERLLDEAVIRLRVQARIDGDDASTALADELRTRSHELHWQSIRNLREAPLSEARGDVESDR